MKPFEDEFNFNRNFADNLRFLRESCELTQQQIAELLGCERSTYSYLELGKTSPRIYLAYRLSLIFHISPELLLTHSYMEGKESFPVPRQLPCRNRKIKSLYAIIDCMSENKLEDLYRSALAILRESKI